MSEDIGRLRLPVPGRHHRPGRRHHQPPRSAVLNKAAPRRHDRRADAGLAVAARGVRFAKCDTIAGMPWGEVELEPEVRDWLEGLDDQRWAQAMFPWTCWRTGARCWVSRIHASAGTGLVLDRSGSADHHADRVHQDQMREIAEIGRAEATMARCQAEGRMAEG
jgi:hypothetical protein